VHEVLQLPGQPLDKSTQAYFEPRFGHDFSRVRVHADARAAESARHVSAHAYTVGKDIVFAAGRFSPTTDDGRRLIAHELTHVVQQTAPASGVLQRSPTFGGCNKDQQDTLEEAIKGATALASRAVAAFEREYPLSYESTAMNANFGRLDKEQQATIVARYKEVQGAFANKNYVCASREVKVKKGKEVVDLCGRAECPGDTIKVFPDFGKDTCPAAPVLLHEAIHNAGGCGDTDKGDSYPPRDPENNAYSYEYFALDVSGGTKAPPKLKKRDPKAPH
jgi:hypothetical protein